MAEPTPLTWSPTTHNVGADGRRHISHTAPLADGSRLHTFHNGDGSRGYGWAHVVTPQAWGDSPIKADHVGHASENLARLDAERYHARLTR